MVGIRNLGARNPDVWVEVENRLSEGTAPESRER